MRTLTCFLAVFLTAALAGGTVPAAAQAPSDSVPEAPSPEAAQRVIDFYYGGTSVVLARMQICEEVPREGDRRYECVGPVAPSDVQVGTDYLLHMTYLVPRDESFDNLFVQYNLDGVTRATSSVSVSGSLRYRTWKSFTLDTPGTWTVKVLRGRDGDVETLRTMEVTASASASTGSGGP
jgi:hypothetical protein